MPNTKRIQLISGLPQSDWKQTDESAADYIKNKPTRLSDFGMIEDLEFYEFITIADIDAICNACEQYLLTAPENITVNGKIISVDDVDGADEYELFLDGVSIGTFT